MTLTGFQPTTIWPNSPNHWAELGVLICTVHLTECSWHVTYVFQSKSTLYNCLNVKELFARNRCNICSLSDCNETRTHNHLVRKRTLKHLAKLTKLLGRVVSTYLFGAFDCMFLSCHLRISEWIHTLSFPEFQGTTCSKKERYLKFKWMQRDSNPQQLGL